MIVGLIGHNGIGLSQEVLGQLYAKESCKTVIQNFLSLDDEKFRNVGDWNDHHSKKARQITTIITITDLKYLLDPGDADT